MTGLPELVSSGRFLVGMGRPEVLYAREGTNEEVGSAPDGFVVFDPVEALGSKERLANSLTTLAGALGAGATT
jgi:hypothetical protein